MSKIKLAATLLFYTAVFCGTTQAQRKVLAVAEVKIADSIKSSAQKDNTLLSLQRVTDAIDGQLIDAMNGTRKFELTARSDLDALLEDAALTGDTIQATKADYLIVPSVDDFQDFLETMTFSGIGKTVSKRKIRLGMVARIYEVKTGKLIESANFQLDNKQMEDLLSSSKNGSFSDELLRKIAQQMSLQVANRVVDVIYPAKILSITGKQAMINRGDGTGITAGQVWEVFAIGEEMIDPDTGESLGGSEIKVGELKITRVNPKFSIGVLTEDFGVVKGSVVRQTIQ
ncbi:hypothetical protein EGM51_11475 [Verrucomicrobia bacterium S94]|nr:hypothetical protein EGM51_11475 [Verrucomicrobia bacterium S94]